MSEPFIAEIRIVGFNFAPRGWAFCDGQILPIAQNTALFSIIGTTYGGDGRATVGLPNLQGRVPIHAGRGPGLTSRSVGQIGGKNTVTLNESHIPSHTHDGYMAVAEQASTDKATTNVTLAKTDNALYCTPAVGSTGISSEAFVCKGNPSEHEHNNMQPFLAMNYVIALWGTWPSR